MKPYRIRFSDDATADLDQITDRIADDSPIAAARWRDQIGLKIERLQDFPRLGPARPALSPDIRTLSFGSYVICYRVMDDEHAVEIGRVLHSARDFPAIFD